MHWNNSHYCKHNKNVRFFLIVFESNLLHFKQHLSGEPGCSNTTMIVSRDSTT